MVDVNKYIQFINGVLPNINISDERRKELTDLRDKVVERYNDPTLYLSMLSGFSAGKSTLINKLIGKNILKTAQLPTTSVPTYIKNASGDKTVITVETVYGDSYNLSNRDDLRFFERLIGMELPKEEWKIISMLTTDEVYKKQGDDIIFKVVNKLTVEIPYESDVENLCIIDTPGINPGGGDNVTAHPERTKHILKNTADCALILFPAHQAYTNDFQEFLEQNAGEFLNDAVFVVTQMDVIEEDERETVLREAKHNLESHFNIQNTNFLYCAAGRAGRDEYWREQFEQFKGQLYKHLREKREQIISRNLNQLLKELLEAINEEIQADNRNLEKKLKILADNSVPELKTSLDQIAETGKNKINEDIKQYRKELDKIAKELPDNIKSRINSYLSGYNRRSHVQDFGKNKLTGVVTDCCKSLGDSVNKNEGALVNGCTSLKAIMSETMISYYGKISQLDENSGELKTGSSGEIIGSDLTGGISNVNVGLNAGLEIAALAGGAAVAAAVFASLGPVGWIAGGLLALFGSDFIGVEKAKDELRDAVFPKLPGIVDEGKKEAKKHLNAFGKKVIKQIDDCKDELISRYEEVYNRLTDAFKAQQKELVSKIGTNAFLIKQTNLLLAELEQN